MKVGIIRCEKNEMRCPLTSCFTSLKKAEQAFASYPDPELIGVFTCRCPGDGVIELAKILTSKGAEVVHFCTCTFSHRDGMKWIEGNGFCDHVDELLHRASRGAEIRCVKGTAHLPEGYRPEVFP